jgi:hypothetical protein
MTYQLPMLTRWRIGAHLDVCSSRFGAETASLPGFSYVNAQTRASSRSGLADWPGIQMHI